MIFDIFMIGLLSVKLLFKVINEKNRETLFHFVTVKSQQEQNFYTLWRCVIILLWLWLWLFRQSVLFCYFEYRILTLSSTKPTPIPDFAFRTSAYFPLSKYLFKRQVMSFNISSYLDFLHHWNGLSLVSKSVTSLHSQSSSSASNSDVPKGSVMQIWYIRAVSVVFYWLKQSKIGAMYCSGVFSVNGKYSCCWIIIWYNRIRLQYWRYDKNIEYKWWKARGKTYAVTIFWYPGSSISKPDIW